MLSLIIAVPLGIAQAVKRNSPRRLRRHRHQLHAVLDAVVLPWADPDPVLRSGPGDLPAGRGRQCHEHLGGDHAPGQLFLPIITLALLNVASFSRYMRSSALDELAQDYIRLARAKGLSERTVLLAPPAAQRLPADDHACRPLDPVPGSRQPADRGAVQLSRAWVCSSITRCATRTTTSCSPTRCWARS